MTRARWVAAFFWPWLAFVLSVGLWTSTYGRSLVEMRELKKQIAEVEGLPTGDLSWLDFYNHQSIDGIAVNIISLDDTERGIFRIPGRTCAEPGRVEPPVGLTDEDIARIAREVARVLKEGR